VTAAANRRVRIRFLGTANAFAAGGRSNACIQLTAPGVSLLLDCGGSALPMLKRHADIAALDGVVVSHLHGDHFGGLPYLLMDQHFAKRTRPIAIVGPRDLEPRMRQTSLGLYRDFFGATRLAFPVRYDSFGGGGELVVGGASITAVPVTHVAESDPHGVRVRVAGKLIAYSGDATWSPALPELARDADLFICEATNFAADDPAHLSYRTLMAHRRELACERIVLTHFGNESLQHLDEIELERAEDGLELEV
jgi:ribonuclease BN (tRNA processing enzyme)